MVSKMRLSVVKFCCLFIFMAIIKTSSGAIAQTNSGAVHGIGNAPRKSCQVDGDCDDGNICTDDTCPEGVCVNAIKDCGSVPGQFICCNPFGGGCTTSSENDVCGDLNLCTEDGPCVGGICTYTDISESCTSGDESVCASCNPQLGCVFTSCDDGDQCTRNTCNSATKQCEFPPDESKCDDHNPCTTDTCDKVTGCAHTPISQCSTQCPCTGGNQCECNGGSCTCVPVPTNQPCVGPKCNTKITLNLDTCGSATTACSGTP